MPAAGVTGKGLSHLKPEVWNEGPDMLDLEGIRAGGRPGLFKK